MAEIEQRCEICGGTLSLAHARVDDPLTHERFALLRCAQCGLGQTWPVPPSLGAYYGPRYHGGRHGITERLAIQRRVSWALNVVGSPMGFASGSGSGHARHSVLDVGCGDGTFLLALREKGWRVAGTELSPDRARAAGIPVVERVEDVVTLEPPFQLVTLWHSLEHLLHPRQTLEQLCGWLAPGGVLLLAVPNADGWQARFFGRHWLHLDVPRHLFHFGPQSLTFLLNALQLQPLKRWNAEVEYDLMGWTQSALDAVSAKPHVLFDFLRGRPQALPRWRQMAHLVAGTSLMPIALLATAAGTLAGQGGTLVMAAQKH